MLKNLKGTANFIFEIGHLKRLRKSGWLHAGVKSPESIAEHAQRAAIIGYLLAEAEGANPEKVACMLLLHDNAETRIGDQDKIAARYYSNKTAEQKAFDDQLKILDDIVAARWQKYFNEFEARNTKEGIVAKDADWLEQAFQAKEYVDLGYESAQDWINNVEKALETKTAKALLKEMKEIKFTDWWQGLKKMTYKKL